MDAKTAIKDSLAMADMVSQGYLSDLSDAELMQRPHPACNHLNWQIGHLVVSEHEMLSAISPDMPPLPEGFADKYTRETISVEDPTFFHNKEQLMEAFQMQRTATLGVLEGLAPEQLDAPSGVDYAPTFAAIIALQGSHWLMHCGQWVIIRRNNGKPVVM